MAERVAQHWAAEAGLDARFTSAGISDEEHGRPIYATAQTLLRERGYSYSGHRAHQITAAEAEDADLLIGMEAFQLDYLRRLTSAPDKIHLLTDFDPNARPGQSVPDPWGMPMPAFRRTLDSIEAAMPEILAEVRRLGKGSRD
jgi:protein-tyrosine phosphatase